RSKRDWSSDVCSSDLFPIPQTDRDRFGAVGSEERDLVLEAALLAQHGQDVCFQRPRELRGRIGLEVQRDIACVHMDSLATNMNQIGRASCRERVKSLK